MNIIQPSVTIIDGPTEEQLYQRIEEAGRTCYRSEDKKEEGSAEKVLMDLLRRGHLAMIEHAVITARFVCDRGVTHEIVRHRIASYAQESTRYCNYSKGKYGSQISVIDLATGFSYDLSNETDRLKYEEWQEAMNDAERHYMNMIKLGASAQEARSVLPNSTKTEIVITMNAREWRHFFNLRALGTTGAPHPQMQQVATMAFELFKENWPLLFEDLDYAN